ncbi:hypothetical protein [Sporomusa malonica]|uniref:Uncharacterized protein n=1 Tax=Sporomusa malonica TaxID=112901 RepID=A0A1W1ZSU1_9FIRM|nr:hypothetical protein [Sporomusa malonica]SMC51549.1 hypothetical protein SAMN04488500_104175 [Sporomusa malonica]
MKRLIQHLLNSILSLVTTFLIMASPIAAVVYASEPAESIESFSLSEPTLVAYAEPAKNDSKMFDIYEENDELLILTFSAK